jgi:hypothetical protein
MLRIVAAAAIAASLLVLIAGGAVAAPPRASSGEILAIYQSAHITEHQRFTVSVEVASTTGIQFVYFNFCQLSSPVCYAPVAMTLHAPNWYVGTTNPMSSYYNMLPGALAGYNITIVYSDNHNITVPAFPNAFSNLTVATEVGSGWYMFEMTVSNLTFNLTGEVQDSATSAALSGAHLTLNPGNGTVVTSGATGAYSFRDVPNGTYRLEATHPGYRTTNQTVVVSGRDTVQDVPLANASTPGSPRSSGSGGASGFLTSSIGGVQGWVIVAVVAVAVVALITVALLRGRGGKSTSSAPKYSSPDGPPSPPQN